MMRRFLLLVTFIVLNAAAYAVEPDEILKDPALEARARSISAELRCLVCQNQSIDDSHAPLARDLRLLVRDRLKAGESDTQIRQYLVERYGDFILLKPRVAADTIILWGAPFLALLLSGFFVWRAAQRRGALLRSDAPLTDDEKAHLDRILASKNQNR
ncbi:MAG: cytochrome c-type biogenesis protein CcmH [Hyphomicrobiales bacterium]|jgi:cytochrome c-type biogenesis protein CcmH|nr:cytochrome c-type biogenesis protein CcmH [Hyphomicrobiales bacterium]NBR10733.1 cytochrome c-type biogenesis protein CcmH [Alphaproteobacteria bacterium]